MDKRLRRLLTADIELVTLPAAQPGCVEVDPHRIEQVIINLAINARDAMPDGGTLMISTSDGSSRDSEPESGRHVTLTVSGDGVGMTEEVKSSIFEPFFTTKGAGKRTGLGLSICHDIVSQAGGRITVESRPGRGTSFRIYLPRAEAWDGPF